MTPALRPRARALPAAAAVAALVAAAALAPPAAAGWEDDYKKGKAAYEEGSPGEAIKHLKSAVAAKPDEKASAIKASGMFFEPYLPHFYLGLALVQKGDFEEAIGAFEKSEGDKVIQKYKDLHAQLRQARAVAERGLASAQPPAASPPPVVAQGPPQPAGQPPASPPGDAGRPAQAPPSKAPAETAAKPPADVPQPKPAPPAPITPEPIKPKPAGPDPALVQALDAAASDIAAAQQLVVQSGRWLEDAEKKRVDGLVGDIRGAPTPAAAASKRQELQRTVADLKTRAADRRKAEEAQQAAAARDKVLKDAVDRAAPAVRDAEAFLAANRAVLQPAEIERIDALVAAVKGGTSAEAVGKGSQELGTYVSGIRSAAAGRAAQAAKAVQEQYARGLKAYFEGNVDGALPDLERAAAALPREPDAQAFLGCALYKKYLLGKGSDAALKQKAEGAFRAALAARRGYVLDAKYFPPKVVAFFKEVAART